MARYVDALKQEARVAAQHRGHRLGVFETLSRKAQARATCTRCGAEVDVNARPMPNETDIAGEAVAIDCPGYYHQGRYHPASYGMSRQRPAWCGRPR